MKGPKNDERVPAHLVAESSSEDSVKLPTVIVWLGIALFFAELAAALLMIGSIVGGFAVMVWRTWPGTADAMELHWKLALALGLLALFYSPIRFFMWRLEEISWKRILAGREPHYPLPPKKGDPPTLRENK